MSKLNQQITTRRELRIRYFSDLKALQRKYDKLLNDAEANAKPKPLSIKEVKRSDDDIYNTYQRESTKLLSAYQTERHDYLKQLTRAKINKERDLVSELRLKLKSIKEQYKTDLKEIKFESHLKTIDPIRANYIKERNKLTQEYRQKLHRVK
jgi:hypothetical protein